MHQWYQFENPFWENLTCDLKVKVTAIQTGLTFLIDTPMVSMFVTLFLSYCIHKPGRPRHLSDWVATKADG